MFEILSVAISKSFRDADRRRVSRWAYGKSETFLCICFLWRVLADSLRCTRLNFLCWCVLCSIYFHTENNFPAAAACCWCCIVYLNFRPCCQWLSPFFTSRNEVFEMQPKCACYACYVPCFWILVISRLFGLFVLRELAWFIVPLSFRNNSTCLQYCVVAHGGL